MLELGYSHMGPIPLWEDYGTTPTFLMRNPLYACLLPFGDSHNITAI